MENTLFTSSSQLSPNMGNPLNPRPIPPLASAPPTTTTIETIVSTPLEPVELSAASNKPTDKPLVVNEAQKLQIYDDGDEIVKPKSCCSMLNKGILALALICFALFLCSLAYIISNVPGVSARRERRSLQATCKDKHSLVLMREDLRM